MNRKPKMQRYPLKAFQNSSPTMPLASNGSKIVSTRMASFVRSVKRSPNIIAWRAARHIAASTAGIMCIRPLARSSTNRPLRSRLGSMPSTSCLRPDAESRQSRFERETGVTYKTAWRMFKQIRSMLDDEKAAPLGGKRPGVEMDEMYFGGRRKGVVGRPLGGTSKTRNDRRGHGGTQRPRRAVVAADVKGSTLLGLVKEHILPKSTVFTDDFCSYDAMDRHINEYNHRRINHSEKIYVMGDVHTNTIEGFWSLVKTAFVACITRLAATTCKPT